MEKVYFHGNNKTDEEIAFAMDCGLGCFMSDCREELQAISRIAGEKGITQKIIMRLTPGIDTHTYEAVRTGQVDSKFGVPIETGQAIELVECALSLPNIELMGFHCHVGSQVFDGQSFCDSADIMIDFIVLVKEKLGYEAKVLNLGGGYGVRYVEEDPVLDIEESIKEVSEHIKNKCAKAKIDMPRIMMEPGRSIVADAGITLYSVGNVRTIKGYKSYVAVDGGMFDNPRYALYEAKYTPVLANRASEENTELVTIAGKCCESGDIIAANVYLPKAETGDILAVLSTGAYNYSMAMNYNRNKIPPCVLVNEGKAEYIVRPQTYEDLVRNDVLPARFTKKDK